MRKVSIQAAMTLLSELVEAALAGEEVMIVQGGTASVRLVPVSRGGFQSGVLKGRLGAVPDFLAPQAEEELRLWEGGVDEASS